MYEIVSIIKLYPPIIIGLRVAYGRNISTKDLKLRSTEVASETN